MKRLLTAATAMLVVACLSYTPSVFAQVGASGNNNQPSETTSYNLSQGGDSFDITEDVVLDPGSGPWLKELVNNSGQGIASGMEKTINETLTNAGTIPWTDWHEEVISLTTIIMPDDAFGFVFPQNPINLMADYGGGFVNLVEGPDYSLIGTPYSGPGMAGNMGYVAIDIFFAPGATIYPGDTLKIEKRIFEVFNDANIWQPGEAAVIAEYPTPEPVSAALFAVGMLGLFARRRETHRQ